MSTLCKLSSKWNACNCEHTHTRTPSTWIRIFCIRFSYKFMLHMPLLLNNWPILCAVFSRFNPKKNEKTVDTVTACSIRLEYSWCEWTVVCIISREVNLSIAHVRQRAHLSDSLFILVLLERHQHFFISCALTSTYGWDFILIKFHCNASTSNSYGFPLPFCKIPCGIYSPQRNNLDRQFSNKCYNFMNRTKFAINLLFSAWMHILMSHTLSI